MKSIINKRLKFYKNSCKKKIKKMTILIIKIYSSKQKWKKLKFNIRNCKLKYQI